MFVAETVHPVEVAATQQAHLVQWLSKRVGHKLTTPDLSARGFALMGGRLLPTGSAAAAQFMYENSAGQRLTLYIRVSTSADTEFRFAQNGEIGAFSWVEDGLRFAMVGATGRDDLLALAEIVYRQLDPSRPPPKAPL
jgi:anti-sigma factor RsiW